MSKVSIIIPTYNRGNVLPHALDSLLAQSYQNFEVIVVDDGSTDNTRVVVDSYCKKDSRIRYFWQENKERSAARNYGISLAQSEYIAFLDSDDVYLPEKIEKQVTLLDEHPEIGFVYCLASWMNQNGEPLDRSIPLPNDLVGNVYPNILLFNGTNITTPSVMLRRELLEKTGGFFEEMSLCEDLDLWHRVSKHTRVAQISEPLIVVRVAGGKASLWTAYKGRCFFYKKAIREDPSLTRAFRSLLYAELYVMLGWAGLRSGKLLIVLFMGLKILLSGFSVMKCCFTIYKTERQQKPKSMLRKSRA